MLKINRLKFKKNKMFIKSIVKVGRISAGSQHKPLYIMDIWLREYNSP